MKLWMVEAKGWGWSFTVVRAETREDAREVAKAGPHDDITELPTKGDEAIVWSWDHSPDTPRD